MTTRIFKLCWILVFSVYFQIQTTSASDLKEVYPITSKILCLHFSDGHVDYDVFGNSCGSKVYYSALDTTAIRTLTNFEISSIDDANYATAKNPVNSGRKSKGQDFVCNWITPQIVLEHFVYIELPNAMVTGKTYQISLKKLSDNFTAIQFVFNDKTLRSLTIHANQVGYAPDGVKYAYLSQWMGTFNSSLHPKGSLNLDSYSGSKFNLVRVSNQEVVFSGVVAKRTGKTLSETSSADFPIKNFSNSDVWECNFSACSDTGTFVISVEGMGCSYLFQIKADVYRNAYYYLSKAVFTQRQGVVKELDGGKIYPRDHHPDDVPVYFAGTTTKANVWGWYHDAGDWDGYQRHLNVPIELMLLYDLKPGNFKDGDVDNRYKLSNAADWILEGANSIPDILDEAKWLVSFQRRAKEALISAGKGTGGVPSGDIGPDAGCENLASWTDKRTTYVSDENTAATFGYATIAAYYSICLTKFYGDTTTESNEWLKQAQDAYNWANLKGNPAERLVADVLLYRATGDVAYQTDYKKNYSFTPNYWLRTEYNELAAFIFALIPPDFKGLDATLQNTVKQSIINSANSNYVTPGSKRGYRLPFESYRTSINGWLSTPRTLFLAVAYELSKNKTYLDYIYHFANYTLGGNENNMVYVGQLGWNPDNMTFHPDSWRLLDYNSQVYTNPSLPGYVNYWGMKSGDWFSGTGWTFDSDEDWSRSSAFPEISKWPAAEWRMNNRWSIPGGEFTMDEVLSQALFTYGYLCGNSNGYTPNQRPEVSLKLSNYSTINSPADELTLSVNHSKDVFKVEYYYNWHFIGSTADSTGGFAYTWKPNLPTGKYLLTAKAYDTSGLPTNPSKGAEQNINVVKKSTVSIPEMKIPKFSVYPNPVGNGRFKIRRNETDDFYLTISDIFGTVIFKDQISGSASAEYSVNTKNLVSGIYFLQLKAKSESDCIKLIVN
jgi:hypothetical protein